LDKLDTVPQPDNAFVRAAFCPAAAARCPARESALVFARLPDVLLDDNDLGDWLVAGIVVGANALLLAWLVGGPTGAFLADALLFLLASIGASAVYVRWATSRSRARLAARGMQSRLVSSVLGRCIAPMTRQRAILQVGCAFIAIDLVAFYLAFVARAGSWAELWWMPVMGVAIALATVWDIGLELGLRRDHR
jgi:hypothetical protein